MKTILLPSIAAAAALGLAGPAPAKAQPIWDLPAAVVGTAAGIVAGVTYPYDYGYYGAPGWQCGYGWGCQPYPGYAEYPGYTVYPGYGGYISEYPAYGTYGYSGYVAQYPAYRTYPRVAHFRTYGAYRHRYTEYRRVAHYRGYRASYPRTVFRAEYHGPTHALMHRGVARHTMMRRR